jgi:response regulator RpfG family c-di-GMP phosphodiesterase
VDRAGDGEEALRRVATKPYDLIVCDLKMPKIDGMQFYQRLSVEYPDSASRVIFVTGDVAGTDAERFLQESGCRWLAKPFRLGGPAADGARNPRLAPLTVFDERCDEKLPIKTKARRHTRRASPPTNLWRAGPAPGGNLRRTRPP